MRTCELSPLCNLSHPCQLVRRPWPRVTLWHASVDKTTVHENVTSQHRLPPPPHAGGRAANQASSLEQPYLTSPKARRSEVQSAVIRHRHNRAFPFSIPRFSGKSDSVTHLSLQRRWSIPPTIFCGFGIDSFLERSFATEQRVGYNW